MLGVLVSLCSIGAGALGVAVLSLRKSLSVFHMAFARPERIVDHSQNQARVRVPGTAAQTRMVSVARTRLEPRKSARPFRIICDDISEIAVGTLITECPPHRSVRAQFGHTAPTLGV